MTRGRSAHSSPVAALVRVLALLTFVQSAACAGVDVMRLTGKTFPPKPSVDDVELLDREPARPHIRLAVLRMEDSSMSFARMQERMLSRAADLGADAVVFAEPVRRLERQVVTTPVYSPWSYTSSFYGPAWGYGASYGPWAWSGYAGTMTLPYDVPVKSLVGTAIRYIDGEPPQLKQGPSQDGGVDAGTS